MEEDQRLERAVDRIGTAMDRIEAALQHRTAAAPAPDGALIQKHEAMRAEVTETLSQLDHLIEGLEA